MKKSTDRQQNELDKYTRTFNKGTTLTKGIYGHMNHGQGLYKTGAGSGYIPSLNITSLLDVGCGKGVFVNDMVNELNIKKVYGLDIASIRTNKYIHNDKIEWIDAFAHDIPLPDNSVEYITSFEVLEHCLEEDIPAIVDEFYRVCTKGLLLSVSTSQAREKTLTGEYLHMTVKPFTWWEEQFGRKFPVVKFFQPGYGKYYLVNKKVGD